MRYENGRYVPSSEPYDALLLDRMTDQYIANKLRGTPDAHDLIFDVPPPIDDAVYRPGFEPYPNKFEAAREAIRGLFRVFRASGRRQLAGEIGDNLTHSQEIIRHVGERLTNPQPGEPKGWRQINRTIPHPLPYRSENFSNLGKRLTDREIGRLPVSPPPVNLRRPANRTERRAAIRMENHEEKARALRRRSDRLSRSYGPLLQRDYEGLRLSRKQRRNMRSASDDIIKSNSLATKRERKVDKIAHGQDVRGKIRQRVAATAYRVRDS